MHQATLSKIKAAIGAYALITSYRTDGGGIAFGFRGIDCRERRGWIAPSMSAPVIFGGAR